MEIVLMIAMIQNGNNNRGTWAPAIAGTALKVHGLIPNKGILNFLQTGGRRYSLTNKNKHLLL